MNNLKKKKKRYMLIAGIDDKNNDVSNDIVIAGLASMIKSVGLATWLESPKEQLRKFRLKKADDSGCADYMEVAFTCSIRKEQISAVRNAFFEYFPNGYIRSLELTKY